MVKISTQVDGARLAASQDLFRKAETEKTAKAYGALGGTLSGKIGDCTYKASI